VPVPKLKELILNNSLREVLHLNKKLVDTEILKKSSGGQCSGSDCRGWLETKILAFCKANLLASRLDKKTFNLVNVLYKSEAKGEYSQFLVSTETGQNIKSGSNEFNSKLLYRYE
jgi:hypothetical protein